MDFSKYHFIYNAAAYFAAQDKYPDGLMDAVLQSGFEGFAAVCWALELLSTQGELIRRDMGHDRQEPLKESDALKYMRPADFLEAKRLIITAIAAGLKAGEEPEEVDEVLMELQKKTETA